MGKPLFGHGIAGRTLPVSMGTMSKPFDIQYFDVLLVGVFSVSVFFLLRGLNSLRAAAAFIIVAVCLSGACIIGHVDESYDETMDPEQYSAEQIAEYERYAANATKQIALDVERGMPYFHAALVLIALGGVLALPRLLKNREHRLGKDFMSSLAQNQVAVSITTAIVLTISCYASSNATIQETPKTVEVHTRSGRTYMRRASGEKQADDAANARTTWMRWTIFAFWAGGSFTIVRWALQKPAIISSENFSPLQSAPVWRPNETHELA